MTSTSRRGPTVLRTTPLARLEPWEPPLRSYWEAYILRAPMIAHYKFTALALATYTDHAGLIREDAPVGVDELAAQTMLAHYKVEHAVLMLEYRRLIHCADGRPARLILPRSSLALIRKARELQAR
ncbi:hypothetical protein AB0P17_15365 [Streptomyces sp. NPDC088124]|uniref:hypothetical protein n=1 Tax=Streptomyces sp. NPDC088124 TaxID=3154654 RepID=UPI00343F1BC4